MANFKTILRLRPSYGEFLHERFKHRGDVLFFPSHHRSDAFSTDGRGFRHSSFRGQQLSVAKILSRGRYGLVLGTSRVFGFGLEGNDKTMPSLLSRLFGFPFANIALPQGNSRNLASLLYAYIVRSPTLPSAVVHFSTGDFTGLAFSSMADPVFGSPNSRQLDAAAMEHGGLPQAKQFIRPMLRFTSLWTQSIAQLCRAHKIPLVLVHDSTFFEKSSPSPRDRKCQLGTAFFETDKRWFDSHRKFVHHFYGRREAVATELNVPLAGPGRSNTLGFIDEFHYDEKGTEALTHDVARALEPLINR